MKKFMKANNQPFFSVSLPTLMVLAGVFLIVSCNKKENHFCLGVIV